jgi:hypothetical protein
MPWLPSGQIGDVGNRVGRSEGGSIDPVPAAVSHGMVS